MIRRTCVLAGVGPSASLVLALAGVAIPVLASFADARVEAPAARPVAELVRSDGTIDLGTGFSGALDLRGYRLDVRRDGTPVVVAQADGALAGDSGTSTSLSPRRAARSHTGNPDDHWLDRFAGPPGADGPVFALAMIGTDLYVGGSFLAAGDVAASHVAKWDGSSWTPLGSGVDGTVHAMAVSGSDLYVGGYFTNAGGVPANRIAKWNGSTWSALADGTNNGVLALAVVGSDVYAGGTFTTAGGNPASGIARWDGSGWNDVGGGVGGHVHALEAVGADLYAGGTFATAGGGGANNVARWNGATWSPLGSGVDGTVRAIAEFGGQIWAGGSFSNAGGAPAAYLARWDGSVWASTGAGFNSDVLSMTVSGSDLFVGGNFSMVAGSHGNVVARWNGSAWSALHRGSNGLPVGSTSTYALIDYDGDLLAAGNFEEAAGIAVDNLARWDGASWSGFGPSSGAGLGGLWVASLASHGDDLYAGGWITNVGGDIDAVGIARWDGVAWNALPSFESGAVVYAMAVVGSDLYVGGAFSTIGGEPGNYIAKWNGSSWSALGSGLNAPVFAITAIGSDLFVGGEFTTAGGTPANNIAKWDGSSWSALGAGVNGDVRALAAIGSDLYAAGEFTSAGGSAASRVARWDGSSWSALGSGTNQEVRALLAVGSDLYAGGFFTLAGGSSALRIARWNGASWNAVGGGFDGAVYSLALLGGSVHAGGSFTTAGGSPASRLAAWNGSSWSALGSGTSNTVFALAAHGDTMVVGGGFAFAGGKPSRNIAMYTTGTCGNGVVDGGEACDPLAPGTGPCCNSTTCQIGSAGEICRARIGPCDAAETCDGVSTACPADGLENAATECHSPGICGLTRLCTGSADGCPPGEPFLPASTVCRATAGICDVAETCTGTSNDCPTDSFLSGLTLCRPASDVCDLAEACTGAASACPADSVMSSFVPCRASSGSCDVEENCDGAAKACPVDALVSAGTTCRAPADSCDVSEQCTGTASACPADVLAAAGTPCRAQAGVCDAAEACNGMSPSCPADSFFSSATVCRASVHPCDLVETCPGGAPDCPADFAAPGETVCRPAADECDVADTCAETSGCASDLKQFPATPCADDGDACTPDLCNGSGTCLHIDVDEDGVGELCDICGDGLPTGQQCDDGNAVSGDGCDVNCTFTGCGNGIVTTGENCDDGNLANDDGCNSQCRVSQCGDGLLTRGQLSICTPGLDCTDACDSAWSYPFGARIEPSAGIHTAFLDGEDFWVGGEFGYETDMRAIAKWNNGVWSALGGGLGDGDYAVYDIVKYGSQIHAGGDFTETGGTGEPSRCLARWDGTAWVEVGGGLAESPSPCSVADLHVRGSDLYVGGSFSTAGGTAAANIARWDGSSWHALGSGTDGRVTTIAADGADLYVGGLFTTAGGVAAAHVARWDGSTWSAVGGGLPYFVHSLVVDDGTLYATGEGYIKQWDGSAWTDLATIDYDGSNGRVEDAVVVGGDLIVGGNFTLGNARNIARWNGSEWSALGSGVDGPYTAKVLDLAADGDRLIVVGEFRSAGGVVSPELAVWDHNACGEACDDANAVDGDGCDSNCSSTACGNGIPTSGEDCDDGDATEGDGCDSNCTESGCGNGIRSAGESCDDGNATDGDGCENDCTLTDVAAVVGPGGIVATPPASSQFPVQTQVTTPTGGAVTIASAPEGALPPGAFSVVGAVFEITAPDASVADPLVIVLTVNSSAIPAGQDGEDVSVTRDGVELGDCTGPMGHAAPDPCIDSRTPIGDNLEIRVLSSHASLWGAVLPAVPPAQQKCANGVAKAAVGVVKSLTKTGAKCLKNAEAGETDLDQCLTETAGSKAGKSMAKTAKAAAACPDGVPVGYVDATTANLAAQSVGTGILATTLGTDMSGTIATNPNGAACRASLVKAINKLFLTETAAFLECQKSGLAGEPPLIVTDEDLAACLDVVQLDAKGKIAAAGAKLASAVSQHCSSPDLVSGSCAGAPDVAACLRRASDCQVCRLFDGIGELGRSCDLYDDDVANGSCTP